MYSYVNNTLENLGPNKFYLNMFAFKCPFGQVQVVLDSSDIFQTWSIGLDRSKSGTFYFKFESKMIMIGQKQFGSVQNYFGSIEEKEKVL